MDGPQVERVSAACVGIMETSGRRVFMRDVSMTWREAV